MVSNDLQPEPPEPPFKKAGMVIHGRTYKERPIPDSSGTALYPDKHALITSYTQGRFYDEHNFDMIAERGENGQLHDTMKYYALPKGGIDPGETVFDAACRETKEETGIDMERLLGPHFERFRNGEVIEQYNSEGYPGVRVIRADPVPYDHTYLSRASIPTRMAMFNIEVDGIEKLRGHLKNQENVEQPSYQHKQDGRVRITVDEMVHAEDLESGVHHAQKYLPFDEYLSWLRLGHIPADHLTIDSASRDPRHATMYQLLDGKPEVRFEREATDHTRWFTDLENTYAPHGAIQSRGDWQEFCHRLPKHEYSRLRHCFSAIKAYAKGRETLGTDHDNIKLDDKDSPLFYYQEGADIVSFERFFSHVGVLSEVNDDYRRAFTGDCDMLRGASRAQQITQSQVAGVVAFAEKRDITRGIERLRATVGDVVPQLKRHARHSPEFDLAPGLLEVRQQQRARQQEWAKRIDDEAENKLRGFGA